MHVMSICMCMASYTFIGYPFDPIRGLNPHLLSTGREEKGVFEVRSISVAIFPSCQYTKNISL